MNHPSTLPQTPSVEGSQVLHSLSMTMGNSTYGSLAKNLGTSVEAISFAVNELVSNDLVSLGVANEIALTEAGMNQAVQGLSEEQEK